MSKKKLFLSFAFLICSFISSVTIAANLLNMSTRGYAGTGAEKLAPGFVISGSGSLQLLIKVTGPSLPSTISNRLMDPMLMLYEISGGTPVLVGSNNDWPGDNSASCVSATGQAPTDSREPAFVVSLPAGTYTPVVSGYGGTTGIALPAITITSVSCSVTGGIGDPVDTVTTVNLTGSWSGSASSTYYPSCGGDISLTLTQVGSSLTGSGSLYNTNCVVGGSGTLSGAISGDNINFGIATGDGTTIYFSGSITNNGNTLSGTYSWPDEDDIGTWSLNRN
jgi:hypothetical protein